MKILKAREEELLGTVGAYAQRMDWLTERNATLTLANTKLQEKLDAIRAERNTFIYTLLLSSFPFWYPELCCSDLSLDTQVGNVTSNVIIGNIEAKNFVDDDAHNPIGMLQELCTSLFLPPPIYVTESEDGPPHQRVFTVSCRVLEYKHTGVGKSKKIAKRLAANKLYLLLKK